ncbi:type II toxin-antitoxin system RelE/ParE family toxin [Variovorax paradoxus]|nr:type II toxin-antitoxin system RelE/ParE family toxin [Variovorax paradoxus]
MTWSLHPGAEQDIAGILDFYAERAGSIVAQRFVAEFERVARLLVEHPGFGTPTASGRRAFPLRVYPHTIVYRELDTGILILVVRHQHRKPSYGGARR